MPNNLAQLARQLRKTSSKGRQALQSGYDEGAPFLETATRGFDPIIEKETRGRDLLMDSYGVNGQEGSDRAFDIYQGTAGYRNALDMFGMDAETIQRLNASNGNLFSGNTGIALSDRARTLQNMGYADWQKGLQGFDPMNPTAVQGNALTNQGNFRYGLGRDTNSSYQNQASNMLSLGSLQENQRQFNESQTPLWEKLLLGGVSALGGAFGA
jgi:hypothetical protein